MLTHFIAHWRIATPKLRRFCLVAAVFWPVVFGLLLPWLTNGALPRWPWYVGLGFAVGAVVPPLARPVYFLWASAAEVVGRVNSVVLLGLTFFVVLTPMGLLMRLRRDPMARRFDPSEQTYRVVSVRDGRGVTKEPF